MWVPPSWLDRSASMSSNASDSPPSSSPPHPPSAPVVSKHGVALCAHLFAPPVLEGLVALLTVLVRGPDRPHRLGRATGLGGVDVPLELDDVQHRVDEGQVGEGLREVAKVLPA